MKILGKRRVALWLMAGLCAVASGQESGYPADSTLVVEPAAEACHDSLEPAVIERSYAPASSAPDLLTPSKRLFGVIPNYRAEQTTTTEYKPLTRSEKYAIARSDSFDWPNYFLLAGYAVQSQVAAGGFSHNGGLSGFAKFYARSVGDQIIGSYVTEAIMPSLLHEDPRFFRLGSGSIFRRTYYAASRVLIVRKDDGKSGLNISELAGNSGVIAITSIYYPSSRSAGAGLERFGMALGNDAVSNLLTEFWPDIKHRLPRLLPFHDR